MFIRRRRRELMDCSREGEGDAGGGGAEGKGDAGMRGRRLERSGTRDDGSSFHTILHLFLFALFTVFASFCVPKLSEILTGSVWATFSTRSFSKSTT